MSNPRWFRYGLVDGPIVGFIMGGVVLLPLADNEWNGHLEIRFLVTLLGGLLVGGMYGGAFGLGVGIVGGMAIDLLRALGMDDRPAVGMVMTPVLAVALWLLSWQFMLVPAAAVVMDLCWRLSRLPRGAPTVLT